MKFLRVIVHTDYDKRWLVLFIGPRNGVRDRAGEGNNFDKLQCPVPTLTFCKTYLIFEEILSTINQEEFLYNELVLVNLIENSYCMYI